MAGVLQHLRSSTLNKRPNPASMVDGQIAINYASGSPGAFFKDSNGNLVKVGPVHVGATAPNVSPASGGTAGNSLGEQWLDTSGGTYVFKIWDGGAWRSEAGEFVNVTGDTMTGPLVMDNQQPVRFREATASGTNYIALQAPVSIASDKTITLPDVSGTVVTTGDSGTITSAMIANSTIVDNDINASAAIAGTKINPNFGSQIVTSSGVFVHPPGTALLPSVTFSGDLNSGIYSPSSDVVAIACSGNPKFGVNSWGQISNDPTFPALTSDVQFSLVGAFDAHTFGSFVAGMAVYSTLVTSGVTSLASYASAPSLQVAVGDVNHFSANNITLNVGGSALNQIGFYAPFGLTDQATYNYGFKSGIGVGSTSTNYSIYTGDADTYLGSRNVIFAPFFTEVARFVPSGLFIGTSIGNRAASNFVVARTDAQTYGTFTTWAGATSSGGTLALGKSRASTPGASGIVAVNDELGTFEFRGDDGTGASLLPAASIKAFSDATPGSADMPGRIALYTSNDGTATPTEKWRVTNDGVVTYLQPAPTVSTGTATLTIAQLKTGIVQYTGGAGTLTLPSGSAIETGFAGAYNNMAFEWSVINTGSGLCTIASGAGNTISGATTVPNGTSGRFSARRLSASGYVIYRLA